MSKNTHGGSRPGSGRKPKSDKKVPISLKISPDVLAFLRNRGPSLSEAAEPILRASKPYKDWQKAKPILAPDGSQSGQELPEVSP